MPAVVVPSGLDDDVPHDPTQSIASANLNGPSVQRMVISSSVYMFLNFVAIGATFTPFTQMVLERACADVDIAWDQCNNKMPGYDDAQKAAAHWSRTWDVATGILQIATCAGYGVIGDAVGRRLPLIMPLIGMFLQNLSIAWMPASYADNALLAAGFITSVLGGPFVTNQASMSSLADVTQHGSAKQRSSIFALVEGVSVAGFLVGPVFGGWCADQFGNQNAFWVFLGFNAVNILITVFTYPETLEKEARRPFNWVRANPFASVIMFFETKTVLLLGIVMVVGGLASGGGSSIKTFYILKVTDMDGTMLGLQASIGMGAACFGLIFAMPLLARLFKLHYLITLSMLNSALTWLVLSGTDQESEFFAVSAMGVLGVMYFPIVRTGMTSTFGRERYGESLAAVATVEQTMKMLSPVIFTTLYAQTVDVSLGPIRCISFVVAACCNIVGALASLGIPAMPTDRRADEEAKASLCESQG